MKIYIASSWKNQHAVEMLTALLRQRDHEVFSWVENNFGEGHGPDKPMDFEAWMATDQARSSFAFDIAGATTSDLVIYLGPAGTDAWAEVGAAYGAGVPVWGLWAKGEPAGLMRKMMLRWFTRFSDLLERLAIESVAPCDTASEEAPSLWWKCLGHDHEDWYWDSSPTHREGYYATQGEARDAWILQSESPIRYTNDPRRATGKTTSGGGT